MKFQYKPLSILALSLTLMACGNTEEPHSNNTSSESESHSHSIASHNHSTETETSDIDAIIQKFDQDSFVSTPKLVDCTLSGGTKTTCVSITIKPQPANMKIGPWCPRNISDGPEASGIWLDGGKVYDVDGAFISNLAEFYKDDVWQMFDEKTGAINVTDSKISCEAAAKPDVDEQYNNYCVECSVSYMDSNASTTYIIPITPVDALKANGIGRSGIGLAYSGALIDASAPAAAILSAHTIAPFDDCGGHVNLHSGYHLHAITDKDNCLKEIGTEKDHQPSIGIAIDGYSIHRQVPSENTSLDSCGGHTSDKLGYHYHAAEAGENKILSCHVGETGCSSENANSSCDASQQNKRRGPPPGKGPPPHKK